MPVTTSYYESVLAEYSNREAAIALLKQHRPYLEMIPSMRRPYESVLVLPLPVARIRHPKTGDAVYNAHSFTPNTALQLPCDLAILMCDPEWKIKMGVEILVFIHRPQEDFSDLLMRWRRTQVHLDKDYEWIMPHRYEHILSEGSEKVYPLFIVFEGTPKRIQKGLDGACLPYIMRSDFVPEPEEEEIEEFLRENG
ncbi:hypothetical protein K4A83_19190 [Spirulina subsalsa FACHB-351]|uniref:Uncharacterized protein n=1 Tax=Spirulina subsalsa FACHB-351 TaxID=234711 RepID=A0ABT3LB93_9CYAN|nr:hypothetical protein [Spirulina subsalsa]MCW6038382.1 hypothetical protein [Spirulina subsalsa FACHB-351]